MRLILRELVGSFGRSCQYSGLRFSLQYGCAIKCAADIEKRANWVKLSFVGRRHARSWFHFAKAPGARIHSCATVSYFCTRFRGKFFEGQANCPDKPRLAWGPGLRTCCMLRLRWNSLPTTFIASTSSNENSRERSDSKSTKPIIREYPIAREGPATFPSGSSAHG